MTDTIVTLYPERWDKGNEQQLHRHILDSVSEERNIHESFHGLRGDQNLEMDLVCKAILKACMSFEAKALIPFVNPDASPPGQVRKVPIPYTKAFSASIARLYFQVTQRFNKLKTGMGSISKDPNKFYRDTQRETAILINIDDTIGEIGMIKRVLWNQAQVYERFQSEVHGNTANVAKPYKGETLERFEVLETEAERVRSMVTTLLDLRQREATLEDALSMGEQSTMLFVFTAVTVLFAPLSFIVGLLALSIDGIPETWQRSPLAEVFGLSTLATGALCVLLWSVFKFYQHMTLSHTRRRTRHRHYRRAHGLDDDPDFNLDLDLDFDLDLGPGRGSRCPWWDRMGLTFLTRWLGDPHAIPLSGQAPSDTAGYEKRLAEDHRGSWNRKRSSTAPGHEHGEFAYEDNRNMSRDGRTTLERTTGLPLYSRRQKARGKSGDGSCKGGHGQEEASGGGDTGTQVDGNLRGGRRSRGMSGGTSVGPSLSSLSITSSNWAFASWNRRQRTAGGALGGREDRELGVFHV
ncbi:unnamed protein product [Sordaria macrospora k-hell]|uniref:WGS project CABT00000000 data, contig 2.31 n=1 Tax=Sordaria macrospora (strain ATCC MYA-333 / DSM 997 / K(L3346) / K-hell) TaxID=771870 RepID=F7W5I5_SORMK|nr:uncharacterized protein SMAC_07618 [Sordaria macrospora k-hell]CCC12773.1 unnamed protein product [Sordaria macrospora k-hell]